MVGIGRSTIVILIGVETIDSQHALGTKILRGGLGGAFQDG
jgi:hypothetical protein